MPSSSTSAIDLYIKRTSPIPTGFSDHCDLSKLSPRSPGAGAENACMSSLWFGGACFIKQSVGTLWPFVGRLVQPCKSRVVMKCRDAYAFRETKLCRLVKNGTVDAYAAGRP